MTCSSFFGHVNKKSVRDNLNMMREFEKNNRTSHLFCFVIASFLSRELRLSHNLEKRTSQSADTSICVEFKEIATRESELIT